MKRQGWLSLDRIVRRDTFRRVVRRIAGALGIADREMTAPLGYSESRGRRALTPGELLCFSASDVPLLCEILGSNEILEEMCAARGGRFVPNVDKAHAAEADVLAAAASALGTASQLVSEVTSALPDGIDPGERRAILGRIIETRRALNALEARVDHDAGPLRSTR